MNVNIPTRTRYIKKEHKCKRGAWMPEDKEFIAQNHGRLTVEEIAEKIDRNPKIVRKYIAAYCKNPFQKEAEKADYDIKKSPIWKDLQRQFSKEELDMFAFHYARTISQFRHDVFPTEELQIIDACKLEVLMNRALTMQQESINDIREFEAQLTLAKEKQDNERMVSLERQIASLRASQDSLTSEYKTMLDQKTKIFREMKATRDQRIKVLEQSKHNFIGWLKQILGNPDLRRTLGTEMEKHRISSEICFQKLSEYYEFDKEGDIDRCILSADTIGKDEL